MLRDYHNCQPESLSQARCNRAVPRFELRYARCFLPGASVLQETPRLAASTLEEK